MKCDVIDGSVVNGLRQPLPFSFVLGKQSGCKFFLNQKQSITKKKSVLNTITFYLDDDNHEEVNFSRRNFDFYIIREKNLNY